MKVALRIRSLAALTLILVLWSCSSTRQQIHQPSFALDYHLVRQPSARPGAWTFVNRDSEEVSLASDSNLCRGHYAQLVEGKWRLFFEANWPALCRYDREFHAIPGGEGLSWKQDVNVFPRGEYRYSILVEPIGKLLRVEFRVTYPNAPATSTILKRLKSVPEECSDARRYLEGLLALTISADGLTEVALADDVLRAITHLRPDLWQELLAKFSSSKILSWIAFSLAAAVDGPTEAIAELFVQDTIRSMDSDHLRRLLGVSHDLSAYDLHRLVTNAIHTNVGLAGEAIELLWYSTRTGNNSEAAAKLLLGIATHPGVAASDRARALARRTVLVGGLSAWGFPEGHDSPGFDYLLDLANLQDPEPLFAADRCGAAYRSAWEWSRRRFVAKWTTNGFTSVPFDTNCNSEAKTLFCP